MSFEFANPGVFWLLLLLPVYLWARRRRGMTQALRYPSVRNLKRMPKSFRHRCRAFLPLMRLAAIILLIVALARPVHEEEMQELPSEGIAIAMVLDRSASMGDPQNRLRYEGEVQYRFDVAQQVIEEFVQGDGQDLEGRPQDLVGLISFATYPRTDHPFTLDHDSLTTMVEQLSAEKPYLDEYGMPTDNREEAAVMRNEHGRVLVDRLGNPVPRTNPLQMTDLRKAIEYSMNKLQLLQRDLQRDSAGQRKYHLRSKVMVLLTDGEPTVGSQRNERDFPDEETIKQLVDAGIRVYFVQILSEERYRERPDGTIEVIVPRRGGLFPSFQAQRQAALVNESIEKARQLARRTDGAHFLATSGDQLQDVYERIDQLERSDVGGRSVFTQEERYGRYLWIACALLAAEALLATTWLRRAP